MAEQHPTHLIEALGHTSGWAVEKRDSRGRPTGQHRIQLWFNDDEVGTQRVHAILAYIGKEGDVPVQAPHPVPTGRPVFGGTAPTTEPHPPQYEP